MDQFDLESNEKDIFGSVDRLLINLGMVLIAFIPTHLSLLFRPKKIAFMLLGEEPDGRRALLLGPGITFILTLLFLLAMAYIANDVFKIGADALDSEALESERSGVRDAILQGNFWRSVILAFPIYLVALWVGIVLQVSHMVCRLNVNLTQSVGIGLYILSTSLLFLIVLGISFDLTGGEPSSAMIGVFVISFFFVIIPWQIFSFSRHAFGNSKGEAAAVALLCAFIFLVCMSMFGFTLQFLEKAGVT